VRTVVCRRQIRRIARVVDFAVPTPFGLAQKIKTRKLRNVFKRWRGIDMAAASIEVSGPNAERRAGELRAALVAAIEPGDIVSRVEVERSAELVVAIIGLVFSGVGTASTISGWWHDHRSEGVKVNILLDDGTQVDLSGVDQKQLEIAFDRRTTSRP
jgi:hypothetical protein